MDTTTIEAVVRAIEGIRDRTSLEKHSEFLLDFFERFPESTDGAHSCALRFAAAAATASIESAIGMPLETIVESTEGPS